MVVLTGILEITKFDPYLGLGVGYRNSSYKYSSTDPNWDESTFTGFKNPFNFGGDLTFGTRYFFTDNIGAYVELGIAKSILQLGLTAKF